MLFKTNGKLNKKGFELATEIYNGLMKEKEISIHTYSSTFSKGYANVKDYERDYVELCKAFNLKYELKNDAPRGGKNGNYILIKRDLRNKFFKTMKESLETTKKEKKELPILTDENLKTYFSKLASIDLIIKQSFVETFKEDETLLILRKEYGISFKQSRIYIKEELGCQQ